ncbi:MAG: hypothetical protein JSR69_19405 [Proteobacteria bacterium]|nr:hypothetical protein [Pseudomonadota bacterium]
MIRQSRLLTALCGSFAFLSAPAFATVSFSTFVSGSDLNSTLSNTAAIGFAYAGDKFVGSVYFGANNNQLYQTDLSGGNVKKFGAPIPTASGELYVSSSLGLGGFASRDIFVSQGNDVYRVSKDGLTQGTFTTSPLSGAVRGIAFDPYGSYNFNMIVTTTSGAVYVVDSSGTPTLLTNVGEDTEGLSFAPKAFGPIPAGTLVVGSEGSGTLRAISPIGGITVIGAVASAEMLNFVPINLGVSGNPVEGFYSANYPDNVVKAKASDFSAYLGDLVVTGETTHLLSAVHWDGSQFITSLIGQLPSQPEDGIFVTADIIKPGCSLTNSCGNGRVPEPSSLPLAALGLLAISGVTWRARLAR